MFVVENPIEAQPKVEYVGCDCMYQDDSYQAVEGDNKSRCLPKAKSKAF